MEWSVVSKAQTVKNPPAVYEIQVPSLGLEEPLEKGMATHYSILAWRIPLEELVGYSLLLLLLSCFSRVQIFATPCTTVQSPPASSVHGVLQVRIL